LATVFDRATLERLRSVSSRSGADFVIDDQLWAGVIYDLAVACHRRVSERGDLVRAALPLYMGRVASFVMEIAEADAAAVEDRIERLCAAFEAQKATLRRNWANGRR
jgi:hypothetical protein